MIQNFEEVRTQLKDLAEVLNSYKSEAVQLRLVELIFGAAAKPTGSGGAAPAVEPAQPTGRTSGRKRTPRKPQTGGVESPLASKPRSGGGRTGPVTTLGALYDEGFFATPRTIGQVVDHCDQNLALKFKSSDFSGPLARYTRDKRLKRAKNGDGQYEYTQSK